MIYWGVTERAVSEIRRYLLSHSSQATAGAGGNPGNAVIYSTRFKDTSECLCVQGCDFDYDATAF